MSGKSYELRKVKRRSLTWSDDISRFTQRVCLDECPLQLVLSTVVVIAQYAEKDNRPSAVSVVCRTLCLACLIRPEALTSRQ